MSYSKLIWRKKLLDREFLVFQHCDSGTELNLCYKILSPFLRENSNLIFEFAIWRKKWFGYRDNFHPTKDVSNVSWQRFTMHFYSRFIDKVTSWQARVAWIVSRNKTRRIFLKMYTSRSDIVVVLLVFYIFLLSRRVEDKAKIEQKMFNIFD